MAISKSLRAYAKRFNTQQTFWYFTKALAVKRESIDSITRYHSVLRDRVISNRRIWNPCTQQDYANSVAGREATSAWARELKVFFALLGTAWVEDDGLVKLTPVGRQILLQENPLRLLEQQVRKYQIANPSLPEDRTGDVRVVPHAVLLELLLVLEPSQITRDEYVFFVSRIRSPEELPRAKELLTLYRALSSDEKQTFKSLLKDKLVTTIGRTFSYAADFLALPSYLRYSPRLISIVDRSTAERVSNWYKSGHDESISFDTVKDWFSHYGDSETTSSPVSAVEYYRSRGHAKQAAKAHVRALRQGLVGPEIDEEEFECRVQGEAALEDWLSKHMERLEPGLSLVDTQYETEDAGRIDILAMDAKAGYVVVELKRDKANDVAIGQLLRYIGWVRMYLSEGSPPRGYVVGDRFDDRIVYAILSNDAMGEMCRLKDYAEIGIQLEITRSTDLCEAKVVDLQP